MWEIPTQRKPRWVGHPASGKAASQIFRAVRCVRHTKGRTQVLGVGEAFDHRDVIED